MAVVNNGLYRWKDVVVSFFRALDSMSTSQPLDYQRLPSVVKNFHSHSPRGTDTVFMFPRRWSAIEQSLCTRNGCKHFQFELEVYYASPTDAGVALNERDGARDDRLELLSGSYPLIEGWRNSSLHQFGELHFYHAGAFKEWALGSMDVVIMTGAMIIGLKGKADILKDGVLVMGGSIIQWCQRGYEEAVWRHLAVSKRNGTVDQIPKVPQQSMENQRAIKRERDEEDNQDDDRDSVKRHRSH
jgi:hypothetical protein